MSLPSNTPPDGDFVSYVERLTNANAAAGDRENLLKSSRDNPPQARPSAGLSLPPAKPAAKAGVPFFTHVKWVVALWIASQALSRVMPGAGFLFLPALLAYGAWVFIKINRNSSGALVQRLRELARQAAQEAQKNQQSRKK